MVEFNVWRSSKFSFRVFSSVTYTHLELWYHNARMRAWQRDHSLLWSGLNVWRPSKFSFRRFSARMRAWQRGHRAFMVEFKRLAAIKFSFRGFSSVTYTHLELWYHKAQIRASQMSHTASGLNIWRLSNFFYLHDFLSVAYTRRQHGYYGRPNRKDTRGVRAKFHLRPAHSRR